MQAAGAWPPGGRRRLALAFALALAAAFAPLLLELRVLGQVTAHIVPPSGNLQNEQSKSGTNHEQFRNV